MKLFTHTFSIKTVGNNQLIDITNNVQEAVTTNDFSEGNALVFVPGATAGITTIEYEPGLLNDYPEFMESIAPSKKNYSHNETWHDGNGHSHIRAALQGASFSVPFKNGRLLLGTWQQIVLIDFDIRARNREIIVQLTGV